MAGAQQQQHTNSNNVSVSIIIIIIMCERTPHVSMCTTATHLRGSSDAHDAGRHHHHHCHACFDCISAFFMALMVEAASCLSIF
jgi:hypothetical protein